MEIPEGARVHLRVVEPIRPEGECKKMSQQEMAEFFKKMAELPLEGPDDGFSGADHDKVLYGKP